MSIPADKGSETRPIVAITMGDPAGIGPEIIVRAFHSPGFSGERADCVPLVVGDRLPLERAMTLLGSPSAVMPVTGQMTRSGVLTAGEGVIPLLSPAAPDGSPATALTRADIEFGRPSPAACEAVVSWIRTAAGLACARRADAICTCPINKEQLHRQGFPFPGHTEFIQELTGSKDVVMMLSGPRLRVALATIHASLADVPGLITKELLQKVIGITAESMLRDFALESPRIAVCGLNPHAGEAGRFGREEIEVIRPVVEEFQAAPLPGRPFFPKEGREDFAKAGGRGRGLYARISGPWPSDTVFHRAVSGEFDAVVAMYHDQGLIPVKLVHFNKAVNVSLGLPIVRTSVDHGTAYDIAGMGLADPGSLIEAVRLAGSIARNRRRPR